MGPRRKKTKHTAQPEDTTGNNTDNTQSDNSLQHKNPQPDASQTKDTQSNPLGHLYRQDTSSSSSDRKQPERTVSSTTTTTTKRDSWYKGGSWRSKASPVAQATRESISVAGGATSEALSEGANQTGRYVHNSLRRSTKSFPSISSESTVHATGSNADADKSKTSVDKLKDTDVDKKDKLKDSDVDTKDKLKDTAVDTNDKPADSAEVKKFHVNDKNASATGASTAETVKAENTKPNIKATKPSSTETTDAKAPPPDANTQPPPSDAPLPPEPAKDAANPGWFGWWSRPDGYAENPEKAKAADDHNEASITPLPSTPAAETTTDPVNSTSNLDRVDIRNHDTLHSNRSVETATSSRSWFRLWSSAQNLQAEQAEPNTPPRLPVPTEDSTSSSPLKNSTSTDTLSKNTIPTNPPATEAAQKADDPKTNDSTVPQIKEGEETPRNKASGWAFWSRDRGKDETATPNGTERQVGELAVADTPSQSHPEAAQFNQERQKANKSRSASLTTNSSFFTSNQAQTRVQVSEATKGLEDTKASTDAKAPKVQTQPNLVIPSFSESFSPAYIAPYWERVATYVASSLRIIDAPGQANHVSIAPTTPKIRSAIAIGVHGYFPAPLIQRVLGQPTGTSIRFAKHASGAIRKWVKENQPDTSCDIETVALEGEGFIADRVATLWKLLLNWLSHLRQADFILVACHSQGVPVAIMLVNKLINLGCLSPNVRVGICAMAGVNLGPFADYKSRLLGQGAAAELFEFSRPGSKVSLEYAAALDGVLRHNVRITYCGSIDDQLVSLESSLFTTLSHPHVYRAVFVDGRLHAPNFLTHLVAFALKLRNLGVSDHGLIRELSLPLAGSLYGGEGHSRIYDENEVYALALRFTLQTTDVLPNTNIPSTTDATERRSSRGGPPATVSAANSLRRGSVSSSTLPGIGAIFQPFEVPASGSNANPYFLPWALRGILEEELVRRDMGAEVQELVRLYEEWRPQSKVLKDVRFRLEGVRSKL